jgi:Ribbon-helix-helix protein, copG family
MQPTVISMIEKRTMTLNLSAQEMDVVEQLAGEKGLSKTALVRQALRLYQSISIRLDNGEKVFFEDPTTKEKAELMVLS